MNGDINIKINKKIGLIGLALISFLALGNFVSVVDAESNGGVTVIQPEESAPIGTVALWTTATPPSGWIEMNGQSTASYPDLANIVGANVPDLRGEFVRGWDNGRGVDTGRNLNVVQSESINASSLSFVGNALPAHTHSSSVKVGVSGSTSGTHALYRISNIHGNSSAVSIGSKSAGTPSGTIVGNGTETKPRNVALMYIIRAE